MVINEEWRQSYMLKENVVLIAADKSDLNNFHRLCSYHTLGLGKPGRWLKLIILYRVNVQHLQL